VGISSVRRSLTASRCCPGKGSRGDSDGIGRGKYTEPVIKTKITPESAYKRLEPYLQLLTDESSPFIINVKDHLTLFGSDEYYQLFRQQLLAMLIAKEYRQRVDALKLLHLYMPEDNSGNGRIAAVESHYQLWMSTLRNGYSFNAVQMPYVFGSFLVSHSPALVKWHSYLQLRYFSLNLDS